MSRFKRNFSYLMLGLILAGFSCRVEAQGIEKHEALFLYNFTKYMKWPGKSQISIGVMGKSSILNELQNISKRTGSKIKIVKISGATDIENCDLVFLPKSQSKSLDMVQKSIGVRDIIIASEDAKLVDKGAEIGFFLDNNKLKFMINKAALEETKVKVSQSLYAIATVK